MTNDGKKPVSRVFPEEGDLLAEAMNGKYAAFLAGRCFAITAEEIDGALHVTTLLRNSDESFYYPVATRIDYKAEELSLHQAFMFLVDYIDSYFEEYLTEDDDLFLPIDWTHHQYEATDFQIKGQILNKKAEDLADKLL